MKLGESGAKSPDSEIINKSLLRRPKVNLITFCVTRATAVAHWCMLAPTAFRPLSELPRSSLAETSAATLACQQVMFLFILYLIVVTFTIDKANIY